MQRYANAITSLICPCTDSKLCMNNVEAVRNIETDMCMSSLIQSSRRQWVFLHLLEKLKGFVFKPWDVIVSRA